MTPSVEFVLDEASNILVTGAGNGIGRSTALLAANRGLGVSLWDIEADAIDGTLALLPDDARTHVVVGDVGDAAVVSAGVAAARQTLGPLRHLANIAGPPSSSGLPFDDFLRVSVGSVRLVTETWAATDLPAGAAMVVTASVAGNIVGADSAGYSAAKAGIAGYVRHLAAYRTAEFRSNAVAPGMTDTRRIAGFRESAVGQRVLTRIPSHRMGAPEEIAEVLLFLLSQRASYVNGVLLPVDGGWTIAQ